jgi:beta-lactamase regulating signal transducer with metallopeptidase domain
MMLTSLGAWIVRASLEAAVLIAVVWAVRALLGRRLPPAWRATLWLLVGLRLTVPLAIESRWSLQRVFDTTVERVTMDRTSASALPVQHGASISTVRYGPVPSDTAMSSSSITAQVPSRMSDAIRQSATIAWLVIALAFVVRLLRSVRRLRRDVATFAAIDDPRVLAIAEDAAKAAGVSERVRLVWSARLRSPAVCGIWRPTIVMPCADITTTMSDVDLRLMLLHEYSHVRGRDALWSLVAGVIAAVHWFNPLVWLAARWLREDREIACDARVLRAVGQRERHAYGECLLRVVERVSHLRPHPAAVGAFGSFHQLRRRIDMITTFDGRRSFLDRCVGVLAVLAIGFLAITSAPASTMAAADEPATPPASAAPMASAPVVPDQAISSEVQAAVTPVSDTAVATQAYDIRDLLVRIPDVGFEPTAPQADDRGNDVASRVKLVAEVKNLIESTVAPDSWTDNGGAIGLMQEFGGQLMITQTKENHAAIAALLENVRTGRALQVMISARFMTVDADKLPAEVSALLNGQTTTAQPASAFIPADQVDAIVKSMQTGPTATTLTAPRVTLFSGQRAFVKVGTDQPFISTYTMTRTEKGERKFEPKIETAPAGVTFGVEATVSADRKYVTLMLRPTVTKLLRMDSEPFAGDPEEKGLVVQKPVVETETLNTTLSIPDGATCILRSRPDGTDRKQILLLLVEAHIVPGC